MVLSWKYFSEAVGWYLGHLNPINSNPISLDFLAQPMMIYVNIVQFCLKLRILLA